MKFISTYEKHGKYERRRYFAIWKSKCFSKRQGILSMEKALELRAIRRALTCLIYSLGRSRTLKRLLTWAQRKIFRRRFALWKNMCFEEARSSISSGDLLVSKRNKLLKRFCISRLLRNVFVARACSASDKLIVQKNRLFSIQYLHDWRRRVLKIARGTRVSNSMHRRHTMSAIGLSFGAWILSAKTSRWFKRCHSSIRFKQTQFLLEICCHGWRLVVLNASRKLRILRRIRDQVSSNLAGRAARAWSLLAGARRHNLGECRDAERLCGERRRRGVFVWWVSAVLRSKAGRLAERRSAARRAHSIEFAGSTRSRHWRRASRPEGERAW